MLRHADRHTPHVDLLYDLRDDKVHVRHLQEATSNRPDAGLAPIPALVGSSQWWDEIDSGRYPSTIVGGTIVKVYWGSMGDWPMFTLRTAEGETTHWTRQGDHTRYVEGLSVRVQYVVQRFKDSVPDRSLGGKRETQFVVRIWLERSELRSEAAAPGPFGVTSL